ncbi:MAG: hypothetical protein OXR68_00925 [Alphaproteobacteria bacterium]|nr:hypothetical protein [Alphaproteobacteria bacterium]MDD9919173.1 hypothetical protein [Alphaproteobacteria bacterium]
MKTTLQQKGRVFTDKHKQEILSALGMTEEEFFKENASDKEEASVEEWGEDPSKLHLPTTILPEESTKTVQDILSWINLGPDKSIKRKFVSLAIRNELNKRRDKAEIRQQLLSELKEASCIDGKKTTFDHFMVGRRNYTPESLSIVLKVIGVPVGLILRLAQREDSRLFNSNLSSESKLDPTMLRHCQKFWENIGKKDGGIIGLIKFLLESDDFSKQAKDQLKNLTYTLLIEVVEAKYDSEIDEALDFLDRAKESI